MYQRIQVMRNKKKRKKRKKRKRRKSKEMTPWRSLGLFFYKKLRVS
jgi:hypothetical protein